MDDQDFNVLIEDRCGRILRDTAYLREVELLRSCDIIASYTGIGILSC